MSKLERKSWDINYILRKLFRPKQIKLRDGLVVSTDRSVPSNVRRALYKERYEKEERHLVLNVVEPEDRVLDIGSGIGVVAATCARICGQDNVKCYEANPKAAALIRRNFALNGIRSDLVEKVMSTHDGTADFFINQNILSSSLFQRKTASSTVVHCDDIKRVINEYVPNVIIMDTEGAEFELLINTDLSSVEKLIVELHPHIIGEKKIQLLHSHLSEIGFELQNDFQNSNVVFMWRPKI